MKYLQSILENESVRGTVQSADELTTLALEAIIPLQVEFNSNLIYENLEDFVFEGDSVTNIYETLSEFNKDDSVELTAALSELMAESFLTFEEKEHIIAESIELSLNDYREERVSPRERRKIELQFAKRTLGGSKTKRRAAVVFADKLSSNSSKLERVSAAGKTAAHLVKRSFKQKTRGLGGRISRNIKRGKESFKEAKSNVKKDKNKKIVKEFLRIKSKKDYDALPAYAKVKFKNLKNKKPGIISRTIKKFI